MIRDSLHFEFAGYSSKDFGIINVNIGKNLATEPFVAPINLIEESIRGKEKPYFKRIEREPLSFTVSFAFEETWNETKIRSVARWLTLHEIYQPLKFIHEDFDELVNNERIYYALVVESPQIIHNYCQEGFVTLTFRCDSSWSYMPTQTYPATGATSVTGAATGVTFNVTTAGWLSLTGTGNLITLSNDGDLKMFPIIKVEKTSDGELSITNNENNEVTEFYAESAGSNYLKFVGIVYDGETITIGGEVYEFDTGDGTVGTGNIIVDVSSGAEFATATLQFVTGGYVKDAETIIVGSDVYEFDDDDDSRSGNIDIDISDSVSTATGTLTFTGNPSAYDYIIIGNTRYIFDKGTNESVIKTTNHAVDAKAGYYAVINRDRNAPATIKFVEAENKDFLNVVTYTGSNPFLNSTSIASTISGQQPGDTIEIYNSKYEGTVATGSTTTQIVTTDTQGLRSGDLVGCLVSGALEFKKIASVSNNNSITIVGTTTATSTTFYGFNRIALRVAESASYDIPNIVVIGADKEESASNLVKAINLDGIPGVDFGIELLSNLLVEAELGVITQEMQSLYLDNPTTGTFTLANGVTGATGTTSTNAIAYNATSTTIQTELEAIYGVGYVTVVDSTTIGVDFDIEFSESIGESNLVANFTLLDSISPTLTESQPYDNDENTVYLTSKFSGSEGNEISTTVSDGLDASFASSSLTGGADCDALTAITKLVSAVISSGTEDIGAVASGLNINFIYDIGGTVGNGVICLSTTEDAKWVTEYFEGGEDPTVAESFAALKSAIDTNSLIVNTEIEIADEILKVTHKNAGLDTNIISQSETYNAYWYARKLYGGRNQLETGEIIDIYTERQQVDSDTDDGNRYDCFNDEFITLELGDNEIEISGDCNIKFWLIPRTIQGSRTIT